MLNGNTNELSVTSWTRDLALIAHEKRCKPAGFNCGGRMALAMTGFFTGATANFRASNCGGSIPERNMRDGLEASTSSLKWDSGIG